MKLTMTRVLTPLAALAFTLGVQAKDYAKDDFEGAWSNSTGGYSFEAGPDQAADATEQYTYDGDAPAAAISPIGGSTNLKGLKLSTEDGVLFRTLTGATVGASGLYVDTDVQFTLTDKSDRPTVTTGQDGDKFIIWLEADEDAGTTNLCVWAREYAVVNNELNFTGSNKVYVLNSSAVTNIVPGTWHRLTVKAIAQSNTEELPIPGFQVYLDNNPTPLSSDSYFLPESDLSVGSRLLVDSSILDNRQFFPAMSDGLMSLAKVGFSGEGKIDDFVVTDDIPSALPRVALTVNWDDSVISNVTFIANNAPKTLDSSGSLLTLEPGATVSFSMENITPAAGVNLEQYSLSETEEAWELTGVAEVAVAAGVATVGGQTGSGAFTIALDRNTASSVTIDWTSVDPGSIASVSYTIDGVTENVDGAEGYAMFDAELDDVVTVAVTLAQGVVGVPVLTASTGATVSGSTFTITANSAELAIALVTPVAMVDGVAYATFADAVAAAKTAGEPVVLCDDITLEEAVAIAANETVTIDLNGCTITGADNAAAFANAGTLTITDSSQAHDGGVVAGSNGSVVANTGTLGLEYGAYAGAFTNSGTFEITTDCEFSYDLDGAYEADDGYVVAETYTGSGVWKLALITYTITYMNGETPVSGLTPATYTVEDDVTLPDNLGEIVGVTLDGWKDGEGNDVSGWTAGDYHTNLTFYAQTSVLVPPTPWYENPQAVVLAENLPGQTGNIVSAFHGQGAGNYLGLTYSTNPLQFDLFGVNGTNALTTIYSVAAADVTTPGFRGVAISETLGVAMTLAYAVDTTMYTYKLDGSSSAPLAVTKSATHSFDAAAFSPNGDYLFSNALNGESSNQFFVKWSVAADDNTGALALTKVGSISSGGRARSMAYAQVNGRDIVFGLVDTGKIVAMDMTDADPANWTAADLITDLPAHSYGTLCVSGVRSGEPKLTVATSTNNGTNKIDVLNVYDVTVPAAPGAVTATLVTSFDEDALTAAGFGDISDANRYGNTVYVTDDNKTIYFARPDNKLYAAQYVAPTPSGETIEPGQQSSATYESQAAAEAAVANVTIAAASDVETALGGDTTAYLAKFEAKAVEVGETGTYKIEVALTAAAATELEDEATTNVALAVAAQLPTIAAAAVGSQTEISVTGVVPGFYYSISYGTAVNAINTEGARVLAPASGSITLQTPAKASGATTGFYRVNVNVADIPAPPPNSGE